MLMSVSNNVSHLCIKLKEEEDPDADTDSRAAALSLSAHQKKAGTRDTQGVTTKWQTKRGAHRIKNMWGAG